MLGEANTKKLFTLKMLGGAGLEQASSTQYIMQGWHKKALSTENAR